MPPELHSIGFIGAGHMAEALLRGVLRREIVPPAKILMVDVRPERLDQLARQYQVATSIHPLEPLRCTENVVLAVKPQDAGQLMSDLRAAFANSTRVESPRCQRVISILAGVKTAALESGLPKMCNGEAPPVVRAMPNMAAALGEGATGVAPGARASRDDVEAALAIMESVGVALELEEEQLDAVTGLAGSGPAYVFRMIEAMIDGGVAAGLPFDAAKKLAIQTVYGAAKLAAESKEEPAELRARVTSKGGTTAAGLAEMERRGFAETIAATIQAATDRSRELGK